MEMENEDLLAGKRILIVDDEADVLDALEDILDMCRVEKATGFHEAKNLLENHYFDMALLDIMGVNGYKLLEIANEKRVIPIMLTAHALSPENIVRSHREGAASYVPKDKMSEITVFMRDVLEARRKGRNSWWRWFDRLGQSYCEKKFGPGWQDQDKEFWEKVTFWE